MKILAIYYAIGVMHLLLTMINDEEQYKSIVEYMSEQENTYEVWFAFFIVLIFTPIIWPQILFYQIFDKEVE